MMRGILHTYVYTSPGSQVTGYPTGRRVMRHLRMEVVEPGDAKFLYQHWNPRAWTGYALATDRPVLGSPGWAWGKPDRADALLYGLDRLLAFRADVTTPFDCHQWHIYLTEGEKDADHINDLHEPHVLAVSHHGGAGHFTAAQADYLRGWAGQVDVCADRDPAGAACALARYDALRRVGIPEHHLRIVRPSGRYLKGRDVSDHLKEERSLDSLQEVDLWRLRAAVADMPPAERRDGSWPRETGDPELVNFDPKAWRRSLGHRNRGRRAASPPVSSAPPKPTSKVLGRHTNE